MENKYYLIDSNIWIAFYNKTDSQHQKALLLFQELESHQKQIIITNFIIQEVFTILTLIKNQAAALKFHDFVTQHQRINQLDLDRIFISQIIAFIKNERLKMRLSLVDYSLLFLSQEFGLEILSFDKELNKTYKEIK